MEKKVFISTIIMLLVLAGSVFAQSNEARKNALQGTWIYVSSEGNDYPMEDSFRFDNNFATIKYKDGRQLCFTYMVIENNILLYQGFVVHYIYTIQGNILTLNGSGVDMSDEIQTPKMIQLTLRKQ